jgi:hypothetical protein
MKFEYGNRKQYFVAVMLRIEKKEQSVVVAAARGCGPSWWCRHKNSRARW